MRSSPLHSPYLIKQESYSTRLTNRTVMSTVTARWMIRTAGITLLSLGTIGGFFSIAIFSHPTLRKCSYARYMLIAAFFDLMTLDHPFVLRILADGWGIDLVSMIEAYCIFRFFTGQTNTFIPITMICLAAVDRWAVSYLIFSIRSHL